MLCLERAAAALVHPRPARYRGAPAAPASHFHPAARLDRPRRRR